MIALPAYCVLFLFIHFFMIESYKFPLINAKISNLTKDKWKGTRWQLKQPKKKQFEHQSNQNWISQITYPNIIVLPEPVNSVIHSLQARKGSSKLCMLMHVTYSNEWHSGGNKKEKRKMQYWLGTLWDWKKENWRVHRGKRRQ